MEPMYLSIQPEETGERIRRLLLEQGYTIREIQGAFGFENPQAIYKWQRGQSLPSVDNLYALSALLQVPMNEIIISTSHIVSWEQQAAACCSGLFMGIFLQVQWAWQNFKTA